MALSKSAAHHRARLAALTRSREPDDPDLISARRDHRAIGLEDHVRKVLAEAPPLSDAQRARIAGLFLSGGAAA